MSTNKKDDLLRIVRGNAFSLNIEVKAKRVDGTVIQDFVLGESNATLLLTTQSNKRPIPFEIDGNHAIVRFDGCLTNGYYGIDMSGTFRGEQWRFASMVLFEVVETSRQANVPDGCIVLDDTYFIDASVTMWLVAPQSDWNETDPTKPGYIKNKPNLTVYATEQELEQGLSGKQNTIDDLQSIRSGAAAGATAYQKPGTGIPESDLDSETQGKIDGGASAYHKPGTGIPKSDLDSSVQTSLGKADTAIQDVTQIETDIDAIEAKIPAAASAQNKLVDTQQLSTATANFITSSVDNLLNYYLKSETYTKLEVQQLVNAVKQFTYEVVAELPAASASTMNKIYLVPSTNPQTRNVKDEFITIDNGAEAQTRYTWEQIGSTEIDLSGYYTSAQTDAAISNALNTALAAYTTTDALTSLLAQKQDVISDLESIRSGAGKGQTAVQPSDIANMEVDTNKVTEIGPSSTNTQYPSAKAVYTYVGNVVGDINSILDEINGEVI